MEVEPSSSSSSRASWLVDWCGFPCRHLHSPEEGRGTWINITRFFFAFSVEVELSFACVNLLPEIWKDLLTMMRLLLRGTFLSRVWSSRRWRFFTRSDYAVWNNFHIFGMFFALTEILSCSTVVSYYQKFDDPVFSNLYWFYTLEYYNKIALLFYQNCIITIRNQIVHLT